MSFNSLSFLLFFAVVYLLFRVAPTWNWKKRVLLFSSYCFYAAWSPPYILLLLFSTTLDWWLARRLGEAENPGRRRLYLLASLACNLLLLGYFKYGDFLQQNASALLSAFGIVYHPLESRIVLPVGISFYTFASLSYTIDVYRRRIRSDWRFADYALFVSFFPHLVAGPIVRADCLLPQIVEPRVPTRDQIGWGLALVLLGLFAKTVLADALYAPVVDQFYADPARFSAFDAMCAVLSFSAQIYYDFSGYSLCAIGLAMCFGFAFPDNFRHPYAARSFSDFWRRWHISLSTWLRDYLYIPLGGNRRGAALTCVFLFSTMLIGGLWHGASWMFVLWGALHGAYLIVERALDRGASREQTVPDSRYRLRELFVFIMVTLAWIPFRSSSPAEAWAVVASFFRLSTQMWPNAQQVLAIVVVIATVGWHAHLRDRSLEASMSQARPVVMSGVLAVCLLCLFFFSGGDQHAFIYFQF